MFGRGTITPANPVFLRLQQKKAIEHWMDSQCGGIAPLPRIPMPQIKCVQQGRRPLAILPQPQVKIRENRLATVPEGKVSKSSSWDAEEIRRLKETCGFKRTGLSSLNPCPPTRSGDQSIAISHPISATIHARRGMSDGILFVLGAHHIKGTEARGERTSSISIQL